MHKRKENKGLTCLFAHSIDLEDKASRFGDPLVAHPDRLKLKRNIWYDLSDRIMEIGRFKLQYS